MLDTLLQPAAVTRLLHLLQAAQPFLTPSWNRLADMCIRLLSISELFFSPRKTDFTRLLQDIRGCTPSDDMNALLCAIRPFCSEEELQMLQMYEQFKQMQKAMEMWKMFSDLMPDASGTCGTSGTASPFDNLAGLFGPTGGTGFDNMFSDFMNTRSTTSETEDTTDSSGAESVDETEQNVNPLLAFLSPEQMSIYNSILTDTHESSGFTSDTNA